jgi:hypothetical protein
MPVLKLDEHALEPDRVCPTMAYLGAVMVWPKPDEVEQRRRAIDAAGAQHIIAGFIGHAASSDRQQFYFTWEELISVMTFLAGAPPLGDIHQQSKPRTKQGLIAGEILLSQCGEAGRRLGLGAAKSALSERLNGTKLFETLSISTIDNTVWRSYRPVAHLWAAQILSSVRRRARRLPFGAVPCAQDDLPYFLACAERLRRIGEAHASRQHVGPVLEASRTWRLPDGFRLPEFAVAEAEALDLTGYISKAA